MVEMILIQVKAFKEPLEDIKKHLLLAKLYNIIKCIILWKTIKENKCCTKKRTLIII
jgi:hypothetical protein